MAKQVLFAYVDGKEHADVAATIEERLDDLVAGRKWASKDVWVVNQREPPYWDLGLNLALPAKRAACVDDVTAIAEELAALHAATGRKFAIGISDEKSGETKDVFVIDSDAPDLEKLRAAFVAA